MDSSASSVLLNGGNEKLIGQRPANSHRPKNNAKEISCQTRGEIGAMEWWSAGVLPLKPITPTLHYSDTSLHNLLSLHVRQRRLERSKMPEILDLEILALQCARQAIEVQIVLRRVRDAAVAGK